jgi:hypothetical protein
VWDSAPAAELTRYERALLKGGAMITRRRRRQQAGGGRWPGVAEQQRSGSRTQQRLVRSCLPNEGNERFPF